MCKARCRGRKGTELRCLCWVHYPRGTSVFSVIRKLSESYTFKMFMELSLRRQVSSQSSAPLPFPGDGDGGGVEFSKLLMMAWSLVTSPHSEVIQEPTKSCLIRTKDALLSPSQIQGIQELCQRPESKTKCQNKRYSQCSYYQAITKVLGALCQEVECIQAPSGIC